jgi:hypothetical protein
VLALVAKLDAGVHGTADFIRTARDVVETCCAPTIHPSESAEVG